MGNFGSPLLCPIFFEFNIMFNEPIVVLTQFEEPLVYSNVRKFIHKINGVLCEPINGLNVILTNQTKSLELYGWASPVAPHVDGSGYIFFCPIYKEFADDVLIVNGVEVPIHIGHVYMLDDTLEHSTKGRGHVVAMFRGAYRKEEVDANVINDVVNSFRQMAFDPKYINQ